jgi:DNA-3-methyladenine glycosylase I
MDECDAPGPSSVIRHHDHEWGIPARDDRKHFKFLVLEGAQAGLNWLVILNKRVSPSV